MTARRIDGYGLVDRSRPLSFTFDGKRYSGFAGDTLASALLANGVRIMGRSFKYHRPRSVWSAWTDEPNAIMTVRLNGREMPNCLATTTYLEDGMDARSVNAWPSAAFDIKGGLDLLHRWLGAGFYYKTFMWPDWQLFEPAIRKMAGLGGVSADVYDDYIADQIHDECETLVVGGGFAGLTAARAAAELGQKVLLVDDQAELGGTLYQSKEVDGVPTATWIAEQNAAIERAGGRILKKTTAFGVYDHNLVGLAEFGAFGHAPRLWRMRAGKIMIATGAIDRPVTFGNNDLPGVMSALAASEYLARYGVLVGEEAVALSSNSIADQALTNLADAGMSISQKPTDLPALRATGRSNVTSLATQGRAWPCDAVLASGGVTPLVHLWRHAGGKLEWCEIRQAFLPGFAPSAILAVGAANGTYELDQTHEEAKAAAVGDAPKRTETTFRTSPSWPKPGSGNRQWIDFQHDVTLKDVEVAARENFVSVEHLKRYTTLGMASDQGKSANIAGLAAMAAIQGRSIPEVGTTTFRPPFVPIPIETYHGHHRQQNWHPVKRMPLENEHRELNAALGEYGGWLRPAWYGNGSGKAIVQAEAFQARQTAGIFDGSPLGKIEVMGPDAEAFLNFVYYNSINTLKANQIRYGFMLTEGGIVMDDGVITRLAEHHFLVSCSSSHVDSVRRHLEMWRQDGHDADRIFVHDMTMNWATVTVTGPMARSILQDLNVAVDISREALPHMRFVRGRFAGSEMRIARVSFSGDMCFELSVPISVASELWRTVLSVGAKHGAIPVGLEALSVLRAEKGYLIIGKDTDGETMPHDLGFGIPRLRKKVPFIGDRSLRSAKANAAHRKTLVGLSLPSDKKPLATGAHVVSKSGPVRSEGYVTSSYHSPTLGHPIALALVKNGAERIGETVGVWHAEQTRTATVCAPCFFDPEGRRLHA